MPGLVARKKMATLKEFSLEENATRKRGSGCTQGANRKAFTHTLFVVGSSKSVHLKKKKKETFKRAE